MREYSEFDALQQGEEEMDYKVEKILGKKLKNGREQYLIKWSGFGPEWNSWEPKKNIQHLDEFKNFFLEEKEEELLAREEKLERLDRCSRRASREALKKIFLINSPNCMRRKIVDEAQVDSMQKEEEDEEEEDFEGGNYGMEGMGDASFGEDKEGFEGGNYGMEGMGEAAFGEADPFTSTDLCKMLGLIDVQFEYNEEDFEYISFEKSFNVRFRQQFQDMNPTASVPVVSDVMSLKYNEFQNMRAGRGKQLASKKVDRIAGSTSNPATSKDLQPTSSGAGSSGQIKKNMLSGKKVVRFAESTSNPASSKDLQPTSSANSNQEFESLLKEDKKVKTKEEHKKERAEAKKNKESEKREKEEKWQKFFEACCDIPTETRKKYASAFVKQRIQPHLLPDLGKDDLRTLGISALGDQLGIIKYIKLCGGTPPEFLPPTEETVTPPAPATPPPVQATPPAPVTPNHAPVDDDLLILEEEEDVYNPTKPILSPAPDRHDIYHIKMPTGESTSKKAKNVLEVDNGTTKTMVVKDASSTLIGRGIVANESAENNRVNLGVEIQNGSKNAKNILEVHNLNLGADIAAALVAPLPNGELNIEDDYLEEQQQPERPQQPENIGGGNQNEKKDTRTGAGRRKKKKEKEKIRKEKNLKEKNGN